MCTIDIDDLVVSAAAVIIDKELETRASSPSPSTTTRSPTIVGRLKGDVEITITFTNPFPIEVRGTFDLGDAVQLTAEQQL